MQFITIILFPDDRAIVLDQGNPAAKSQIKQLAAVECEFFI